MVSLAARLREVLTSTSRRLRLLTRGGEATDTLTRIQETLVQSLVQGAASRRWLGADVDVRVDEIDTELEESPTATAGVVVPYVRTWARRMVVSASGAPRSMIVVVLHRQALEPAAARGGAPIAGAAPGSRRVRHFPVMILAGHMGPDDARRVLAIPDAEDHLPRLAISPDGRIVVDRRAAQYRREYERQFDQLDAVVSSICRDPRVATLLQDWVSDSER